MVDCDDSVAKAGDLLGYCAVEEACCSGCGGEEKDWKVGTLSGLGRWLAGCEGERLEETVGKTILCKSSVLERCGNGIHVC